MSIVSLPDHVAAQIKSSATITSLNSVICGLLRNSLDAQATKITISLDYSRGNCSVEDNGNGIPPDEFTIDGGLGKAHSTSKFPPRADLHGRHGAFLASLTAVCLLSITSHHHRYHSHNFIRFHNSAIIERRAPCAPEQRLLGVDHGSRVVVRDLFGSMPVRVKQRALENDRGATLKHWERLKHAIVALILAWPSPLSISLRNTVDGQSLSLRNPGQEVKSMESQNRLSWLASSVAKVLRQSTLIDEQFSDSWVPLAASVGQTSVTGAVSLIPVATKKIQFLSLGVRPLPNENGPHILYDEINRLFANSAFGTEETARELDEDEAERRALDSRYKTDSYTGRELKGKRGIDRWPVFSVRIDINSSFTESMPVDAANLLEERKDSTQAIIELLGAVFHEFLRKHQFRPRRLKKFKALPFRGHGFKTAHDESGLSSKPSTPVTVPCSGQSETRERPPVGDLDHSNLRFTMSKGRTSRPNSPFDIWTRIKSGAHTTSKDIKPGPVIGSKPISPDLPGSSSSTATQNEDSGPLLDEDGMLLRVPFPDVECPRTMDSSETQASRPPRAKFGKQGGSEDNLRWTNPVTKEVSTIDSRTGFAVFPPSTDSDDTVGLDSRRPKRLRLQKRPTEIRGSAWTDDLLSSWQNPVFRCAEPPIPVVFDETKVMGVDSTSHERACGRHDFGPWNLVDTADSERGKIPKDALCKADIIAQVDRKFIFVKIPSLPGHGERPLQSAFTDTLVIIDQHAADERCRVEALMKGYFEVVAVPEEDGDSAEPLNTPPTRRIRACMVPVGKPIKFELSTQDALHYGHLSEYFEYWGIKYRIYTPPSRTNASKSQTASQLQILKLPPSISERCQSEPRLLIELLRGEVWRLDEHGSNISLPVSRLEDGDELETRWLSRLHGCPRGILDMINSRACRSAIMFNDALSHDACEDLVRRLADCVFPFQCAHGRPSMVPLVNLDHNYLELGWNEESTGQEFSTAYRKWKS